jgi:hypothetical protein
MHAPCPHHAVLPSRTRRGRRDLWVLVAVFGLAGCSDLGEPIRLSAHAELSVGTLDFGTVAVSANATRSVIVGNSGGADLHGAAAVSCAGFSIQSGGGAFSVPPGGQHAVVVAYSPSSAGASSCQLELGPDIPPVGLVGAGALQAPGAQCTLSVPSLVFVTTVVGGRTEDGYTIFNPGTAPLILNVVPSCNDFVVVSGGGPSTLQPGGSLAVIVQFVPHAGGSVSCDIANGPDCPDLAVSGTATSVSFATDIRPILNTRGCFSCHGWTRTSQIVDVVSQLGYAPAVIVKPGDLLNSVLYQKITNTGRYGQLMPQGGPQIPLAERDKFQRWILEGALDN